MDLAGLLVGVLRELEGATDAQARALLSRLREGTYTPEDASDVADRIERFAQRASGTPGTPPKGD